MPYPPNRELDITELQPEGSRGGQAGEIGEEAERCIYCGKFTNRDRYGIPQCCDDAQWDAMED